MRRFLVLSVIAIMGFTLGKASKSATCTLVQTGAKVVKGTVTFSQEGKGFSTRVLAATKSFTGLTSKATHAIVILDSTSCDAANIKAAATHFGENSKTHGSISLGGNFHNGDLGDITQGQEYMQDVDPKVLGLYDNNVIGKALVIREKPNGNTNADSGEAITCCIIKEDKKNGATSIEMSLGKMAAASALAMAVHGFMKKF